MTCQRASVCVSEWKRGGGERNLFLLPVSFSQYLMSCLSFDSSVEGHKNQLQWTVSPLNSSCSFRSPFLFPLVSSRKTLPPHLTTYRWWWQVTDIPFHSLLFPSRADISSLSLPSTVLPLMWTVSLCVCTVLSGHKHTVLSFLSVKRWRMLKGWAWVRFLW